MSRTADSNDIIAHLFLFVNRIGTKCFVFLKNFFSPFSLVMAVHILHLETFLQNAFVSYRIIREVFKKNGCVMKFKDY